jgi:hypothetical protein
MYGDEYDLAHITREGAFDGSCSFYVAYRALMSCHPHACNVVPPKERFTRAVFEHANTST